MTQLKEITANTFYQMLGKVITISITFVITLIITRIYGVEGYGAFSLMLSYPSLFYIIADFGMNAIGVREITSQPEKTGMILSNIASVRVVLSALLILIGILMLWVLPYSPFLKFGIVLGLATILTRSLFATLNIFFQAKLRYDISIISTTVGYFGLIVVLISAFFVKFPVSVFVFGYFLVDVISIGVGYIFAKKLRVSFENKINRRFMKNFLLTSFPLGLMFAFSQINFKADSVMISFLKLPSSFGYSNVESVGIYGLPYKVFEIALVVPTYLMNSLYPIMLKRYSLGLEKLLLTFKKYFIFLLVFGIGVGVTGFFLSGFIINVLGGENFRDSVLILQILLSFIVIFYLTQPLAWLIVTLKGEKNLPYIYFLAAIFNLTLNYIFIPKFSFYASATITWVSELLILLLLAMTARKLILKHR